MAYTSTITYTPVSGNVAGGGWGGATSTPAAVGDSGADGYAENAICRADFVPYQLKTGTFYIGALAFHIEGIDRLELAIDGGNWVTKSSTTTNPDTGVTEYTWPIVCSRLTDGDHEARIIAYPTSGVPRVVSSVFFTSNENGTAGGDSIYVNGSTGDDGTGDGSQGNPYQTITYAANHWERLATTTGLNHANIYLAAGSYTIATDFAHTYQPTTGWVTIQAAPGVAASEVLITDTALSGVKLNMLHWKNVTFAPASGEAFINPPSTGGPWHVWTDGVVFDGPGRETAYQFFGTGGGYTSVWITDCDYSGAQDGVYYADLVRNTEIHDIMADAYHVCPFIVGGRVYGVANYVYASGTNLTVDGSNAALVTPDGYTPTGSDVGKALFVSSGGAWAEYSADITDASGGKWTVDPDTTGYAALGASGGTWELRGGVHPDVWQILGDVEHSNVIIYDVDLSEYGEGQGITMGHEAQSGTIRDMAVVNVPMYSGTNSIFYSYTTMQHVLVKDCNWSGNSYLAVGDGFDATNFVFDTCVMTPGPNYGIDLDNLPTGVTAR